MKKISIYLSLILFGLAIGCSKDDADNDAIPTDPNPALELITTIQIGNTGGQLVVDDFELTVPQGSFSTEHEVKLYKFPEKASFDGNEASVFYKVSGIPNDYSQSLQLRVKTNGSLSESTLIALGESNYVSSLDSVVMGFQLLPSTLEADWVQAEIPSLDVDGKGDDDETDLTFGAVTGYKENDSKGNFKIYFPKGLEDKAAKLNLFLEEAYTLYNSQPFGFKYDARTSWPVSVTIKKMGVLGFYENSKLGNNWGYMMFNSQALDNEEELKITAGHEFFHLVQSLYDPRFGYIKAIKPGPFVWFDEATAAWAEEKFSTQAGYASVTRSTTNKLAVFNGAQVGSLSNPADHGYGMSTLIKYLVNKPTIGEGFLVKVYEKLYDGTTNPLSAVNACLPDPMLLDNYYGDLIDDYINGEIYDDVSPSTWIGARDGVFTISKAEDSLATFNVEYPHYSANVYQVKLLNPEFTDEDRLQFSISGGSGRWLHVYKYNSSGIEKISDNYDEVIIPDIKNLKTAGWNLVAVVVNTNGMSSYEGSDLINLKMSVESGEQVEVEIEYYDMGLMIYANMEHTLNNDTTVEDVGFGYGSSWMYANSLGTLDGNTYSAQWDDVHGESHRATGHFTFEIDFNTGRIVHGEIVSKRYTLFYNDSTVSTCTIQNVPLIEQSDAHYKFAVSGSALCDAITEFTYVEYSYPSNSWEHRALDYFCEDDVYFELLLGDDWGY